MTSVFEQREEAADRLAAAMAAAGDVVYEWNLDSDTIDWTGNITGLLAHNSPDLIGSGERFQSRISPEDLPRRLKALSDHYQTGETYDCEYRLRQADGAFCWVHDRGRAECTPDGMPLRLRGVLRLVNRRKQYEAQLEHLANFDELTGHFNRSRLRDALIQSIAQSQRYGTTGAYLTVGIDKLALVNEAFGYASADAVIVGVGERIERTIRQTDTVGRVGGDLYGVVMGGCSVVEASAAAEKILRLFRDQPVATPTGPVSVTVSIGAVTFPDAVSTAYDAMAKAESALREAKSRGRDCVVQYALSEAQQQEHRRNLAIGEEVKAALKADRLLFAFQPVVAAGSGEIDFYECLLRIVGSDGEIIPAGKFIPVVEQLGMHRVVDRRVLELAVHELEAHQDIRLALNISAFTLTDQSWLRALVALLKDRPAIARRLIVEITETAAIEDLEDSAGFVSTCRDLGCSVALDDFGAGYTSFRHLKALAVDIVKIDGSFVRNLSDGTDNLLFVRSLLGLAKGFGLKTVAECVETGADATRLRIEGVDWLQGYHFGRPTIQRPWLPDRFATGGPGRTSVPTLLSSVFAKPE